MRELEIRHLGPGDEDRILEAGALFDDAPSREWAAAFLDEPTHHLFLAYAGDEAAGFVSAVELIHPDKGRELFLYELSVAEAHRRQGVATALLKELEGLARDRGCYDVWVLTDDDNDAALATYRSSGATGETRHVLFEWKLEAEARED